MESAVSNGACLRTMLIFLSIIPIRPPACGCACRALRHARSAGSNLPLVICRHSGNFGRRRERQPEVLVRSRNNRISLCREQSPTIAQKPLLGEENGLLDNHGHNMGRVPTCGSRPTLATPPPPNTHLLLSSPHVPRAADTRALNLNRPPLLLRLPPAQTQRHIGSYLALDMKD